MHRSAALRREPGVGGSDVGGPDAQFAQQAAVADQHPSAVPRAFGPEARQRADVGGARGSESVAGSLGHDGPGDRVLGSRFDGGGGQQRVRAMPACVLDQLRPPSARRG